MKSTILACVAAAMLAIVASPCQGQVRYPTSYNWRYKAYNPGYYYKYPGSYYQGPINAPYLSTTRPYFGTRAYYDAVPYGSSWYSGYYASPVYNGGHSYNFEPYYGP